MTVCETLSRLKGISPEGLSRVPLSSFTDPSIADELKLRLGDGWGLADLSYTMLVP